MNYKGLVETALLAGEIMLASGAETYRVEDTITHILKISGLETTEAIVTGMAISVTLADEEHFTISSVKRVSERATDLGKVYQVNTISRQFCSGMINMEEAYAKLKDVKSMRRYGDFYRFLGNVGTVTFFVVLLGGTIYDFAFATLNGLVVALCLYGLGKIRLNNFFTNVICACVVAVLSTCFQRFVHPGILLDVVISGSILPLVPGVAITNAIRDTLQGDYMSGGARAIEAFLMAISISIGIGVGLTLFKL